MVAGIRTRLKSTRQMHLDNIFRAGAGVRAGYNPDALLGEQLLGPCAHAAGEN